MLQKFRKFLNDTSGAVTVDWVVLTAAVVGLNVVMIINIIEDGLEVNGQLIGEAIGDAEEFISDPASSIIELNEEEAGGTGPST